MEAMARDAAQPALAKTRVRRPGQDLMLTPEEEERRFQNVIKLANEIYEEYGILLPNDLMGDDPG